MAETGKRVMRERTSPGTGVGIAAVSRVKMHSVRCVVSNCGDKATLAPADSIAGHHRHSHTVNTGDTQSGAWLLLLFPLFFCCPVSHSVTAVAPFITALLSSNSSSSSHTFREQI